MRYLIIIALLSLSFNAVASKNEDNFIKQAVKASLESMTCVERCGQEQQKVTKEEIGVVVHFLSDVDTNMNALIENTRHTIHVVAKRVAEVSSAAND